MVLRVTKKAPRTKVSIVQENSVTTTDAGATVYDGASKCFFIQSDLGGATLIP